MLTQLLGECEPILTMQEPFHYRNKVHHVFAYAPKRGVYSGIYAEGSHKVAAVEDCLLEDEKAQAIIHTVERIANRYHYSVYHEDKGVGLLRHIIVRTAHKTGEIMVTLVTGEKVFPGKQNFVKLLRREHPEITTIIQNVNNKKTSVVLGDDEQTIYGPGFIIDELLGCRFRLSSKSFYQVNPTQTEKLYSAAINFADLKPGQVILDTYCGIGTIGIIAAKQTKAKLIGVELNPKAVADARENAKRNGVDAQFIACDATKYMLANPGKADVVFMDPPRSGATMAFIEAVAKMGPRRVVYVSCDPETLARDLRCFRERGYKTKKIQPVDMFCQTEHVETVVLMSRVSR